MTIKITKQLATMEDLAIGTGTVVQERNGVPLTLTKIDFNSRVIRVTSIAAMEAYSAPVGYVFSLNAGGRSGTFDVLAGAAPKIDPQNGVFIALENGNHAARRVVGGYSIKWFGAIGDATSNDTVAIQAAIDFSNFIYVPEGEYLYSSLTINRDNVCFKGDNRAISKLVYADATGEGIEVSDVATVVNNVYIENLWMGQAVGVERTSGSHIKVYNFTHGAIKNIYFTDSFKGITAVGCARSEMTDVWFRVENGRANAQNTSIDLQYNSTTDTSIVNCKITRADCAGSTGFLDAFIRINSADWIEILTCHANKANYGLVITNDSGVRDIWLTDTYFDEAVTNNVKIVEGTGGVLRNIQFNNCYFRFAGIRSISCDNTTVIQNLTINGGYVAQSNSHGFYQDSNNIKFLRLTNIDFLENSTSTNGSTITSRALRTIIKGCYFSDNLGAFEVNNSRSGPIAGTSLVTDCNFAGSITDNKVQHINVTEVRISGNSALKDLEFPLLENYGSDLATTNADGLGVIPHSLGVSPAFATVDLWNATKERAIVASVDSTNINIFAYDEETGTPLSFTRQFKWKAQV